MKLSEIEEGSSVSVIVSKDNTGVELPSEVVKVYDDCILAKPFMHDNSLIRFDVENLTIEMMVVKPGEVPYNFKNVQISLMEVDGETYHCLRTGTIGVRQNRRNAFRVFIGENGTALEVRAGKRAEILVKDLSSTGVGFFIDNKDDPDFEIGTQVHVSFSDSNSRTSIEVDGRVIRKMEQENRMLYGCMFSKHYPAVEKYTAMKQVRKNRNKKTLLK